MQCQTGILRSAWEHAIGNECGLVRLQAHFIELHNITKFLQGYLQGVYPQIGWTGMRGQLQPPNCQTLLILLTAQVYLEAVELLGSWEGRELQPQLTIAYVKAVNLQRQGGIRRSR